jgi:5-methylcytosine-specific restriction endonuclease McrA
MEDEWHDDEHGPSSLEFWDQPLGRLPPHIAVTDWRASPERELELRRLSYSDYRRTPEWQYRRRQMVQAAERKCQHCGSYSHRLNVHHRSYDRLGNEDPDDLIVLCVSCHRDLHPGRW